MTLSRNHLNVFHAPLVALLVVSQMYSAAGLPVRHTILPRDTTPGGEPLRGLHEYKALACGFMGVGAICNLLLFWWCGNRLRGKWKKRRDAKMKKETPVEVATKPPAYGEIKT